MPNLHPFLVHFPVALLSLSVLCECAALLFKREDLSAVGWWTQLAGTIGLAAAAGTGIMAGDSVRLPEAGKATLEMHQEIAFVASTVFAVLLFWRIASGTKRPPGRDTVFILLFAAGVAAIWAGAWYGGELVYIFGAGVHAAPVP
ncbi:MAG TPA: DUF2231 domain-containing protein [Bacteroidota bacterium]|nr:DUF2231 domain-containing protein [Bacteroidota bacterium]